MKRYTYQIIAALAFMGLMLSGLLLASCDTFAPQPGPEPLGTANPSGTTHFMNVEAFGDLTVGDDLTIGDDTTATGYLATADQIKADTIAEYTASAGVSFSNPVYTYLADLPKTTSYTVTAANRGTLFHNTGASAEITFTLPSAADGLHYCFYVAAAYTITVDPATGDQVHHLTNSAGDRVQNTGTAGDSLCIQAIDTTYWFPTNEEGTWSDAN